MLLSALEQLLDKSVNETMTTMSLSRVSFTSFAIYLLASRSREEQTHEFRFYTLFLISLSHIDLQLPLTGLDCRHIEHVLHPPKRSHVVRARRG